MLKLILCACITACYYPNHHYGSMLAACTCMYLSHVALHHAARGPASKTQYQFELENQAGQALSLAPAAREALVTGLALHDRAQRSLQQACAS